MAKPDKYKRSPPKFLAPEVLEATARMAVDLTRDLNIPAAVAGGYAMQIYGSPRLTGDVDMIAADAPSELKPLKSVKPLTFGGRRYRTADNVELDIIKRSDHLKGLYDAALEEAVATEDGLPIVAPDYLAVIKFAAGRPKDEDDLVWLLQQSGLVNRKKALEIAAHYLGGQFASDLLQSFIDKADWRTERERKNP